MDTSPEQSTRGDALVALRATLDQSGISPKSLDRNIVGGTWNVRGYGKVLNKWDTAAGDSLRRNLRDVPVGRR